MIIAANGAFCQQYFPTIRKLPATGSFFIPYQSVFYQPKPSQVLPANFYCTQLGFFCKKELKFEAVTKIPFKFRLGSIQYTDWLEGKINTRILSAQ